MRLEELLSTRRSENTFAAEDSGEWPKAGRSREPKCKKCSQLGRNYLAVQTPRKTPSHPKVLHMNELDGTPVLLARNSHISGAP